MYKSGRFLGLFICLTLVPSIVFCNLLFTVINWNTCLPDESSLKTIVGISLLECIVECGKRRSCEYIGYVRYVNLCQLYTDVDTSSVLKGGMCLLISKGDIDNSVLPDDCICDERQVCKAGICEYEECSQPYFANGYVIGNRNDVGSSLIIYCETGYIEVNNYTSVTCGISGNWSYSPSCISTIVCSDITIANGDLIGHGNGIGAERTIVCDTGYEETLGVSSIQCDITGIWSYIPSCSLIIVCGDITVANGDIIGTGNGVGAVRTIACDTGYTERTVESSIQCDSTGNWNYIPTCSLIIVCDDITVANGDLIGTGNGVGSVRTIACDTGYTERTGKSSIQCDSTGNWNYIPTCSLIIVENNNNDDSDDSDSSDSS